MNLGRVFSESEPALDTAKINVKILCGAPFIPAVRGNPKFES